MVRADLFSGSLAVWNAFGFLIHFLTGGGCRSRTCKPLTGPQFSRLVPYHSAQPTPLVNELYYFITFRTKIKAPCGELVLLPLYGTPKVKAGSRPKYWTKLKFLVG